MAALGRLGEAREAYDRALALQPEEPRFYYNRACAWAREGRREAALADVEEALRRDGRLRRLMREDKDFDELREDPAFRKLAGEEGG